MPFGHTAAGGTYRRPTALIRCLFSVYGRPLAAIRPKTRSSGGVLSHREIAAAKGSAYRAKAR